MSPPGGAKGRRRKAQPEGTPMSSPRRPPGAKRSAESTGSLPRQPGRRGGGGRRPDPAGQSAITPLAQRHCTVQPAGSALAPSQIAELLAEVPGWRVDAGQLTRRFEFADFHRTMAFVNAVAWIAHAEDHHPELVVEYGSCTVRYRTHSANGLTVNDFICAGRIEALLP